jgi:glycosyltransferase involved in cell wall biosynthesis
LHGGAEQWLVDLMRFLDPRRVQVQRVLVARADQVDLDLVARFDVPVEIGQQERVRRAAAECDVLLCWGLELNAWLADYRPKLCIFLAHGDGDWTRHRLLASDQVVDHVVAVSRRVMDLCCGGFPTTVIWNGIDSTRLARTRSRAVVRESLGFQADDFVVGYVGRFSAEKRPGVVLEAVALLPPPFKALLMGWGPQRAELMDLANARLPGRYAFSAASDHLGDYYQAMDAVCLASEHEGFPLVILEAMMCGRPLIVTPVGCVPEIIQDRINGLIVSGDARSICAAATLLRQHPDWARGIAAEGYAHAEKNGHALRMARDYENLLHALWVEKHGPLTSESPESQPNMS